MPLVSLLWMADQDLTPAGRRGLLQDQDCGGRSMAWKGRGHLVTWWSMDSMDSMVSMPKNTVVNYGLQVIHSSFPDDFVGDHDEMMISIDFWTMF